MKNIVIDTSFMLTALKFKIDIKSELSRILDEKYSLFYIDKTLDELKGKQLGKLAIQILSSYNAVKINTISKSNVDSLILDHSKNHPECIIATQDLALKEKLKKRNVRLIVIRQKTHLKLIN